ncbi:MAG: hypothetical protein EAZ55_03215 [Cytophagales bacterium]|nr:MAG: hypothetical protein EAZ55_03215 [Cytophagales bacterium]
MIWKILSKITFGVLIMSLLGACKINYSFTGYNTTAETLYVGSFYNIAGQGPATLGYNFTERLKEYYQQNSPLQIVNNQGEADLVIEGAIVGFTVTPIAATGNDQTAFNRLTITVNVDYKNFKEENKDFKQSFSFYADFEQRQTLTQVQDELSNRIFEQIAFDIFNKTVADW